MQMLPSTFAAHAAPGHTDIYNPVDNLIAAIRYIQRRYADPRIHPGSGRWPWRQYLGY